MIQVQCDGCQKRYSVPDNFAGKKVRCKQCSAVISIPAAATLEELAPDAPASTETASAAPAAAAPGPKKALFGAAPAKKNPFGPKPGVAPKKAAFGAKSAGTAKPLVPRKPSAKPQGSKPAGKYASKAEQVEGDLDAAESKSGGSRKKLVLIAGGSVAVLAILAVAYFLWFAPGNAPAKKPTSKAPVAAADKDAEKKAVEEKKDAQEKVADEKTEASKDATEPAPAEPGTTVEPLNLIPADVNLVASVAFGRLANISAVHDPIEEALKSNPEMSELFADAGFDPIGNLSNIWIAVPAGGLDPEKAAQNPQFLAILQGTFDKEKVLDALKKRSVIPENGKKVGSLEVHELREDGQHKGYITFASHEVLMLGTDETFNKALKLVAGGSSVRTNKALKDITKDFGSASTAWVAVELPKELKDMLAAKAKETEATPMPVPILDGGFLTLDPSEDGEGIKVALSGLFPDDKERQKAQQSIAGLKLTMAAQLPPPLKALVDALKIKPEGKTLHLALDLPKEQIDALKQMIHGAMGGAPPVAAPDDAGAATATEPPAEGAPAAEPATEKAAEGDSSDEKPADATPAEEDKGGDEKKAEEPPAGDKPDEKDSPKAADKKAPSKKKK